MLLALSAIAKKPKYANDMLKATLRKHRADETPDWRIWCWDCPGKLYFPGPGETLSNLTVHLQNRQHRQRVNKRLAAATATRTGENS
ncbi:hypothetical protein GALMADRAFT_71483 [Galerina marginata CBS 339.88]|uniref:Uncharacterized protein n=1 Tax=Galerina marginata (strain CBS 339.88) TaxID=685588 RepID=A0A067T285_GALM3|nr:hypothetical protein GALMADRAFT_71483 [Galerina marginata CBS 339.88]